MVNIMVTIHVAVEDDEKVTLVLHFVSKKSSLFLFPLSYLSSNGHQLARCLSIKLAFLHMNFLLKDVPSPFYFASGTQVGSYGVSVHRLFRGASALEVLKQSLALTFSRFVLYK